MPGAAATRAVWATLLLCGLALAGCREVEGPDTQVMLRIHCQDRALISAMTSLRVHFALEEDEPWSWQSYPSSDFAKGALFWPVDIPIVPGDPGDERKRFEVVVEAMDGPRVLAQQRAVTGFVAGGLRLLEVWLYTCPGQDALHCLQPGCERDRCAVCQLDGDCGSSVIPRERLPAFDVDEAPISRPPFDTTGAPSGAMAPGGSAATPQSGTGASAGVASPTGGAPAGAVAVPGGGGAGEAGTVPSHGAADAGVGASTGSGVGSSGSGGSVGAGGLTGATVLDAAVRDAGVGTASGTMGGTTAGSTGAILGGGASDTGVRDAGPRDAGLDSSVPREASVPEGGTIGGFGGGMIEAGGIGGSLGGMAGGPGATSAFSFEESEFGPGSYSGR